MSPESEYATNSCFPGWGWGGEMTGRREQGIER
jgi:hypothetical protein